MIRLAILFSLLIGGSHAWSAPTQKLKYASKQRSYQILFSDKALSLMSAERNLSIPVSECNRALLNGFWQSAVEEFKSLAKGKDTPYLELNQERRLVSPFKAKEIARLDREIFHLMVKERRQCAKS